jgi:hypothetical protein
VIYDIVIYPLLYFHTNIKYFTFFYPMVEAFSVEKEKVGLGEQFTYVQ